MKIIKQNSHGFTLIELLVVIAIVGVLSGVVLQSLNSARMKSRDASRLATVDQIQKAFEISATLTGKNSLPTTTGYTCLGLVADTSPTCGYTSTMTPGGVLATAINTPLAVAISGNVIPADPSFKNGIGVAYLYNSNVTPATVPASTLGAYLSWVIEGSTTCGRGVAGGAVTNGTQCFLRIGNAI